jgi:membrane fusion protein (multidrug efflux system)
MRNTMKRTTLLCAAIVCVTLLCGCDKLQKKPETVVDTTGPAVIATPVEVTVAKAETITKYQAFGGEVACARTMDILPETTGKISTLSINDGDTVEKGQVVAMVDQSKPGLNYQPSPVTAQMGGTVSGLNVHVGSTVAPSLSMGKILSTDDLEITFLIPERLLSTVKKGSAANLTFDAFPGETFQGKVSKLSPSLDTTTRTRKATLKLDTRDERIIPGLYARVRILVEEKENAIVIPVDAVSGNAVFIIDGTLAKKSVVTLGIEQDGMVEVLSGVKAGDKIVTKGQNQIADGTTVNVIGGNK